MDRETRHELDNLLEGYRRALDDVRYAGDDAHRIAAWRKIQTLGWRLNEMMAAVAETVHAF